MTGPARDFSWGGSVRAVTVQDFCGPGRTVRPSPARVFTTLVGTVFNGISILFRFALDEEIWKQSKTRSNRNRLFWLDKCSYSS